MNKIEAFIIGLAILFTGFTFYIVTQNKVLGSSNITQGIVPKVATSSTIQVGPQNVVTVVPANTACVSRTISTLSQTIMLSFSSTLVPSASQGLLQATSTTVAYDNGAYGCGAVTAFATASTTITTVGVTQ